MWSLVFVSFLVAMLLVWLIGPTRRGTARDPLDTVEPPDQDELEAAEREVQDPEFGSPTSKEVDERDWGPGAPH